MMINRWLGTESDCFDWTNGRSGARPFLGRRVLSRPGPSYSMSLVPFVLFFSFLSHV